MRADPLRRFARSPFALALAGALAAAPVAESATPATTRREAVGPQFQVSGLTSGDQQSPAIATDAQGNFVVAFAQPTGSVSHVWVQRYNAAGVPVGDPKQVISNTTQWQYDPAVAMTADGRFVVVYSGVGSDESDGLHARLYDAAGEPASEELTIDLTSGNFGPKVAVDGDGDFVVAWTAQEGDGSNNAVFAQRFNAAGAAQGTKFLVNDIALDAQLRPDVAMDSAGNFVIAWSHAQFTPNLTRVRYRRYNAAGVAGAAAYVHATTTSDAHYSPSIGMDADGDFVIVWTSGYSNIMARRFGSGGAPLGAAFLVDPLYTYAHMPDVAVDADGDFTVAFTINNPGVYDIYARRFTAGGAADGNSFPVNHYTSAQQDEPEIAMDPDGNFIVAWDSEGQDGDGIGVFAQRYALPPQLVAAGRVNAGTAPDHAILIKHNNARRLCLRDGATGGALLQIPASALFSVAGLDLLPDVNDNTVGELVQVGKHRTSGAINVLVNDAATGDLITSMNVLGPAYEPLGVRSLADLNASGKPEIAVLGRTDTGTTLVQLRDSIEGTLVKSLFFLSENYSTVDIQVVPDMSGNGAQELAVIGGNAVTGGTLLQLRDALTGELVNNISFFGTGVEPIALAVVADLNDNGGRDFAVLGRNTSTGAIILQRRDGKTDALLGTLGFLSPAFEPEGLEVLGDFTGNGAPEIAVLGRNPNTGAIILQRRDALDGTLVNINYTGLGTPEGLAVIGDVNGNSTAEVVVLGVGPTGIRTQTRDGSTGALISNAKAP